MVKAKEKPNKLAYIFYEGYTEKIFYRRIFSQYLAGIPNKSKNLETGSGVNKDIASEFNSFTLEVQNPKLQRFIQPFLQ